jgi:CHAT domain-containing protein/Tfp pilus assembly protein PilF
MRFLWSTSVACLVGLTPMLAIHTVAQPVAQPTNNAAQAAIQQGDQAFGAERYSEAIAAYQRAANLYQQQGNRVAASQALLRLGRTQYQQKEYRQSVTTLLQAQDLADNNRDLRLGINLSLRLAYMDIGRQAQAEKRYGEALNVYEKALAAGQAAGDHEGEALSYLAIATLYREQQRYLQAVVPAQKAVALGQQQGADGFNQAVYAMVLAAIQENLGQYTESLATYQQAMVAAQKSGDRSVMAGIFNNMGAIASVRAQHRQAFPQFEQALKLIAGIKETYAEPVTASNLTRLCEAAQRSTEVSAPNRLMQSFCGEKNIPDRVKVENFNQLRQGQVRLSRKLEASVLNNMGLTRSRLGNYPEAISLHQQASQIARDLQVPDTEATSLNNIGNVYSKMGQYGQALVSYQASLKLIQTHQLRAQEGLTLNNIGQVYLDQGDYPKAEGILQQSLMMLRQVGDRHNEATALNNIGVVHQSRGQYAQAQALYQQSLAIHRDQGNRSGEAIAQQNLAQVAADQGDSSKAVELFQTAIKIFQDIGERGAAAQSLTNLARFYTEQSQYAQGLTTLQTALAVQQEIGDRPNQLWTLMGLGVTYRRLGRYAKSQTFYQQANSLAQELANRPGEASSLSGLAMLQGELRQPAPALTSFQQALAMQREMGVRSAEVTTLMGMGKLQRAQGQTEQALQTWQTALTIAQAIGLTPEQARLMADIGQTQTQAKPNSAATKLLEQALQLSRQVSDRSGEAMALTYLGQAQLAANNPAAAVTHLTQAMTLWEALRPGLTDADKVSLIDTQKLTYELLQQALVTQQQPELALQIAERGRARAFVEMLAARLNRDTAPNFSTQAPNLEQIRRIAKTENATLVQYSLVSEQELYIWVIRPTGQISFHRRALPGMKAPLGQLVVNSRAAIGVRSVRGAIAGIDAAAFNTPDSPGTMRLLHQLLIEPIALDLPSDPTQKVIFIPQGSLFLVPFAALEDGQGRVLIEQHTVATAPALQALALTQEVSARSRLSTGALVVGNPTMPKLENLQLAALPGAEQEAQQVAQLLRIPALVGNQATKADVLKRMPSARIIHLATHGLLETVRGDVPGAVALAPDPGSTAEANGLLTAGEILDLRLNADLVVLSACSTGRGDITGDGVVGLSRSLFVAGTPSVIVSLWDVSDDATALLMTEFYRNWHERKLGKAQALRQAMLTTRQQFPHPRDWAAFNLMGESN